MSDELHGNYLLTLEERAVYYRDTFCLLKGTYTLVIHPAYSLLRLYY